MTAVQDEEVGVSSRRLLVVHGGAPTSVINASLFGILKEARRSGIEVVGARGGTGGLLAEALEPLSGLEQATLGLLPFTPGSLIGSSRTPMEDEHIARFVRTCVRLGIDWVVLNGGNGTMDTCARINRAARSLSVDLGITGVPKTIDNDLGGTDHAPGFGSAARYLAATVAEIVTDARSLPLHVCVVEAMGRNAGWLTAASALAARVGAGPDLVYVPERAFGRTAFLERVAAVHREQGSAVVVVSEGLRGVDRQPIVPPVFQVGRSVYFGDTGAFLAELIIKELGIKARSEKPGIAGRASIAWQSAVDRREAIEVGREAVRLAAAGRSGMLVSLQREPGAGYRCVPVPVPLDGIDLRERVLPDDYLDADGTGVTSAYLDWLEPLVGELPAFANLHGGRP